MNELTKIDSIVNDPKQLADLKKSHCSGASELEFNCFLEMAKALDLNPFLKEIYLIKTNANAPAQIFVSRDGYRTASQRNPEYDYHFTEAIYTNDTFKVTNGIVFHEYQNLVRGDLIGAYCVVKRKNSSREICCTVKLSEYNKGRSNWLSMPEVMIRKVAESSALRMAFASQFNGTYHEYEQWDEPKKPPVKQSLTAQKETPIYEAKKTEMATDDQVSIIVDLIGDTSFSQDRIDKAYKFYGLDESHTIRDFTFENADHFIAMLTNLLRKIQADNDTKEEIIELEEKND